MREKAKLYRDVAFAGSVQRPEAIGAFAKEDRESVDLSLGVSVPTPETKGYDTKRSPAMPKPEGRDLRMRTESPGTTDH